MKTCPVCNALTFDDAVVCYGCMHRYDHVDDSRNAFEEGESVVVPLAASAPESGNHLGYSDGFPSDLPPEFCIKMVPNIRQSGAVTWDCSVELMS